MLQCSPLYLKMLLLSWGKTISGLPGPLISSCWFGNTWHIEAALLKWCSFPEPLNTFMWCFKCSSTSPWPRVQLCLPVWDQAAPQGGWPGSWPCHGRHCSGGSNLFILINLDSLWSWGILMQKKKGKAVIFYSQPGPFPAPVPLCGWPPWAQGQILSR